MASQAPLRLCICILALAGLWLAGPAIGMGLAAAEGTAAARGLGADALRQLAADGVALDQPGITLHHHYALAVVSGQGDAMEQRRALTAGLRQIQDALLRQRYADEAQALGDLWPRVSALLPLRLQSDGAVLPLDHGLQGIALRMEQVEPHIARLPERIAHHLVDLDWRRTPLAAEAMLTLSPVWDLSPQRRALASIDPEALPPASRFPRLAALASLRQEQGRDALEAYARACVAARLGAEAEQAVVVLRHYKQLAGLWPLLAHTMAIESLHQHQQLTHGDTMSMLGLQPRQVLDDAQQWLATAASEWQQEQPGRALLALRQALGQWPRFSAEQQEFALQLYIQLAEALALPRTRDALEKALALLQAPQKPADEESQP